MYYFPWTKLVGEYGCSPLGVWLPQLPFGVKFASPMLTVGTFQAVLA